MRKHQFFTYCLIISILSSCARNYLDPIDETNFSRLLKAPEAVEAVDFIIKPEGGGFLVLGNAKTINNVNANSNLILYNLDEFGFIIKVCEILTNEIDEGEKLYLSENDNKVFILGNRTKENNQKNTIIIETDLNGNIPNYTEGELYENTIEIAYKQNDPNTSFITNDLVYTDNFLVISGMLDNNGNTNSIARSYLYSNLVAGELNTINYEAQIPIQSVLDNNPTFDGSKFIEIDYLESGEFQLAIYGEKVIGDGQKDISSFYISDISRLSFQSPSLAIDGDQNLSCFINSKVDNSLIFVGPVQQAENDSLYIIRGYFNPNNSQDSIGFSELSISQFENYGNNVSDITENANGDIFLLTVNNRINNGVETSESYILKFSFLVNGTPLSEAVLSIAGGGLVNAKKLKYSEKENALFTISTITFGTEETAIELNKIRL